MNAPFAPSLTDRERRWLRHVAVHGPQSSEFLLELSSDTHSCRHTGLKALKKLRAETYLRYPPQQDQIAKADFNPHVYDLAPRGSQHLRGLGDQKTLRPTGHWWHSFLTASITSAIDVACQRRGHRYIPGHEILNRSNATLAVPIGRNKLIPDQLFAIDYGGSFRSFVLEVDRGTEPYRSQAARKSLRRMIAHYADLSAKDTLRRHYRLKSPLLHLFAFSAPERAARCLDILEAKPTAFAATACVCVVPSGFPRFQPLSDVLTAPLRRARHAPIALLH